jgi:hypothetical protein
MLLDRAGAFQRLSLKLASLNKERLIFLSVRLCPTRLTYQISANTTHKWTHLKILAHQKSHRLQPYLGLAQITLSRAMMTKAKPITVFRSITIAGVDVLYRRSYKSSCYGTSISVTTFDFKYDEGFVVSA